MKGLLAKIFAPIYPAESRIEFDEAIKFFKANGMNEAEKLDFPDSKYRYHISAQFRYNCWFDDLSAKLMREGKSTRIVIKGFYFAQVCLNHKNSAGVWNPGRIKKYIFSIVNNKFSIEAVV